MSVRELFIQAPILCGASNAERNAAINQYIFDTERNNRDSVYVRNKEDEVDPVNRLAVGFQWPCSDESRKIHIMNLIKFNMLRHYIVEHKELQYQEEASRLEVLLLAQEEFNAPVAEILTVAQAAMGYWF